MSNALRQLNKLFVGNVPWTVSQHELKKYFSEFGQVINATVMFDKNTGFSKGYGFVTFSSKDSYEKVFNTEFHTLEGSNLNVQPADTTNSKPSRR